MALSSPSTSSQRRGAHARQAHSGGTSFSGSHQLPSRAIVNRYLEPQSDGIHGETYTTALAKDRLTSDNIRPGGPISRHVSDVSELLQPCTEDGGFSEFSSDHADSIGPNFTFNMEHSSEAPQDATDTTVLWACPFSKWKPLSYHSCDKYILKDISRVKQHLNRSHKQPLHCPVCWENFQAESAFYSHVRDRTCTPRPAMMPEGVTSTQKNRLERRVDKRLSKREQWYSVFSILFPGQTMPGSPYMEIGLSADMLAFQNYVTSEGLQIVETIAKSWIPATLLPYQEEVVAFSQTLFQQAIPEILKDYELTRPIDNSPDSGNTTVSCPSMPSLARLQPAIQDWRLDVSPDSPYDPLYDQSITVDQPLGHYLEQPENLDPGAHQDFVPAETSITQPYFSLPDYHSPGEQTQWGVGEDSSSHQSPDMLWSGHDFSEFETASDQW